NGTIAQASSTTATFTTTALTDGDVVTARVTTQEGCSVMSSGIPMTVHALPVASLVSSDADNSICAGTSVTFTATPSGGSAYNFTTSLSGLNQNTASNVFTTTALVDGDVVSVVITSADGCDGPSADIAMNVDAVPVATLDNDDADDEICAGAAVEFTAG